MTEGSTVIAIAACFLIAVTVLVTRAAPVGGPIILGVLALTVGLVCLTAAAFIYPGSSPAMDLDDMAWMILGFVGLVHVALSMMLYLLGYANERETEDPDAAPCRESHGSSSGHHGRVERPPHT